jgi:hypothetical protein
MSVAATTTTVRDRTKTVTRRAGWKFLQPGDRLQLVLKAMGLPKGESPTVLTTVIVVDVRRERLDAISTADVTAEGFPSWSRQDFIAFYSAEFGVCSDTIVTRIEWAYLESAGRAEWCQPCLPGMG